MNAGPDVRSLPTELPREVRGDRPAGFAPLLRRAATLTRDLRRQLEVQAWVVVTLVLGFVVGILISRLALARLGEAGYGKYALIVGFSGILAFADFGLVPGVTRGVAPFLAIGDRAAVEMVLRRMDRLAFGLLAALTTVCAALVCWSMQVVDWRVLHGLAAFGVATLFTTRAETRAALLRVSGAVVTSYWLKAFQYVVYLSLVFALYRAFPVWSGFWVLCYAQAVAAYIQYVTVARCLSRRMPAAEPVRHHSTGSVEATDFWAEASRLSSPERLNRVIQLVVGAMERPLLLATTGLAIVTSYDLLLRLMLLVSAVPAALSQPLLAMLSHDAVRDAPSRTFSSGLRLTRIVSAVCAFAGLIVALALWMYFHSALFGMPSRIPAVVAVVIAVVAAVNVLTAPGTAALLAEGIVGPIMAKTYVEAAGTVIGGIAAWLLRDGLAFIVVRNAAIGVGAIGFLIAEERRRRVAR